MNKRLYIELQKLIIQQQSIPLLENNYLVHFEDENMNKIYTLIKGPRDSVYRHKFIRLDMDIPKEYPYKPPKITFINYDGVRIHPTLYEDGRCCSTILNTWPSIEEDGVKKEAWVSSMGIETILLMFHSFLDNNPYTHEPGGRDDTSYTDFVLYQTWETCLMKYLYMSQVSQPIIFIDFMNLYLINNIESIFNDLYYLKNVYKKGTYYTPCFYIDNYIINYDKIIYKLENYFQTLELYFNNHNTTIIEYNDTSMDNYNKLTDKTITEITQSNNNNNSNNSNSSNSSNSNSNSSNSSNSSSGHNNGYITCNICFQDIVPEDDNDLNKLIVLECNHVFHNFCIKRHILHNGNMCSLCRSKTNINEWLINPETKKRIKIDSNTFKQLLQKHININNHTNT